MSSLSEIGQILRDARLRGGISPEEAAAATRMSARRLLSLEEGIEEDLPEPFYVRSFIRKYGDFLGLSGTELSNRYWENLPKTAAPSSAHEQSVRWVPSFLIVLLTVLALGFAWRYSVSHRVAHPKPIQAARRPVPPKAHPLLLPQPRATSSVALLRIASPSLPLPKATASVRPVGELELVGLSSSWIRVTVDGKIVHEGTLAKGQTLRFRPQHSLRLRVGNAAGIRARFGGKDLGVLGKEGQVLERTFEK